MVSAPQVHISMGAFWWNKDYAFSNFVLLCYTISSIMHAEMTAIFVWASLVLLTEGLNTDPGRTCWSQGWSSRSLDHPSDCQSQSSSRRTCHRAGQMLSSVLRSSPQNSHWKTGKNIQLTPQTYPYTYSVFANYCKLMREHGRLVHPETVVEGHAQWSSS